MIDYVDICEIKQLLICEFVAIFITWERLLTSIKNISHIIIANYLKIITFVTETKPIKKNINQKPTVKMVKNSIKPKYCVKSNIYSDIFLFQIQK